VSIAEKYGSRSCGGAAGSSYLLRRMTRWSVGGSPLGRGCPKLAGRRLILCSPFPLGVCGCSATVEHLTEVRSVRAGSLVELWCHAKLIDRSPLLGE
jgi:hypothetical protein